jgi:hypothetical protein
MPALVVPGSLRPFTGSLAVQFDARAPDGRHRLVA